MECNNPYEYLPEVGTDDGDLFWSPFPAKVTEHIYVPKKARVEDSNSSALQQESKEDINNRADPYQLFPVPFHATDPQFTLEIVKDMQRLRGIALDRRNHRHHIVLKYHDMNGDLRVCWRASEDPQKTNIAVYPLCLSEMTRSFQRDMPHIKVVGYDNFTRPYSRGDKVELIHKYNESTDPTKPKIEWIPLPFVIDNVPFQYCDMHEDENAMRRWYALLSHTTRIWKRSKAKTHTVNTIQKATEWCAPINKIVCIGLGTFDARPAWYSGVIQHLFAISVAFALNQVYQKRNPGCDLVQIILQDPMYVEKDKMLLNHICPNYPIQIVQDPDALLATNKNTLVIPPFLTKSYPLMQIYAGIFKDRAGPAGFLCDEMKGGSEKKEWRCMGRDSPAVWRMLEGYQKCTGEMKHELDEELLRQVNGFYWMEKMDLHLRGREMIKKGIVAEGLVTDRLVTD